MNFFRVLFALALAAAFVAPAAAQQLTPLGVHGDWLAYTVNEGGRKVCYIASKPTKSQGKYTTRGEVVTFVTVFNPAPTGDAYYAGGQVSIVAGYDYQKDSSVQVTIGSNTYTMYTLGDTAWATSGGDDKVLIEAMKKGITMTVKGTSWRPTSTTDIYSLRGFTAAYNTARKACG